MYTMRTIHHIVFSITLLLQIINISADQPAVASQQQPTDDVESSEYEVRDIFVEFRQPISFTRQGMKRYLKYVYNRTEYCTEYLPHNFCHFIEFLEYGKKTEQEPIYVQSAIRLFSNKVKATRYITAYAFADMTARLPDLLSCYFKKEDPALTHTTKDKIVTMFYDNFLSQFSLFKKDPKTFLNDLATEVLSVVEGSDVVQKEVDREQLRQTLIRFLELSLDKVIWSPIDQADVWESVKVISKNMTELKEQGIINQDDLDDLFKSLLERFCHFLDLAGSDLSMEVINCIKQDIVAGKLLFLELEEQEDFIETKAERLNRALLLTEAKVLARSFGIISEVPGYKTVGLRPGLTPQRAG